MNSFILKLSSAGGSLSGCLINDVGILVLPIVVGINISFDTDVQLLQLSICYLIND